MRRFAIFALLVLTSLPALAQHHAGSCSFTGVWQERSGFVTAIDDQRQWRTWSDAEAHRSEAAPAGRGWVVSTEAGITFDYEGAETGYEYEWRFDEGCQALRLDLVRTGGEPAALDMQLHFTRM